MERIPDERTLVSKLKADIDTSEKDKIILLGGHFPLDYGNEVLEGIHKWGAFSPYSLELACEVGKYGREEGKGIRFIFLVDDHRYENWKGLKCSQITGSRRRLYRERSGKGARLPEQYREIMEQFGFSEEDVIRHDHGKVNRHDCLYFSEKVLRDNEREIKNDCAREYVELLESEYFDRERSHLISFIPDKCSAGICNYALDVHLQGISACHVFIHTDMEAMEIFGQDTSGITIDDLYNEYGVHYRKD